uniref:Receptor-like serine/threonine-protein kinase n=1 Tax=Quercus lobata TaxID=97700 RepID=A0A7N2LDE6_QUELO
MREDPHPFSDHRPPPQVKGIGFGYPEEDCNIRLDKPLVAGQNSNPITSRSKEFAFGFHPLESEKENQFLLAVWFYKTKEPTIVWSANGNKPAPENSELRLSSDSEFVLYDHEDNELWKAPTPRNSKSSCAAIRDNGNLVILDERYNPIWESFKEPKDTILPGQILDMDTALRSRQSDTNYSDGRFQLSLQLDGKLVLYSLTKSLSSEPLQKAYFATGTLNWESQLNFTEDGYMYIKDANESNRVHNLITNEYPGSKEDFYYLARIDHDGVYFLVTLLEVGSVGPTAFVVPLTVQEGRHSAHVLLDFPPWTNPTIGQAVYDDKGKTCKKKQYPLSSGRKSPNITSIALIKVPKNIGIDKKGQSLIVVLAVLLGSSAFLNILFFLASSVAIIYLYHKKLNLPRNIDSTFATNVRSYTYKELEEATRGFKQILGKGAFGTVYKGVLASDSKRFVAVKKLDKMVEEGEKEFKTEVSLIGQTHHKNLVQLRGYCDEGQHRLLVDEYMNNGSLATFLFGISRPHWDQRVQIAFGISRGLMYLHEECSTQIIHCDIKPQNILLDECFTPRIADFGLAKLLLAEQTRAARTGIRGTIGYFAPEWFRKGSISVKVDVYSFGVMLLEIICCKSSVTFALGEEEALIDWAYECYKNKRLEKLIENDEEAKHDMKRLERLVIVAIWCIHEDPSQRPSMIKVTQMLEGVIEVSVKDKVQESALVIVVFGISTALVIVVFGISTASCSTLDRSRSTC